MMWLWLAPLIAYLLIGAALVVALVVDDLRGLGHLTEPIWHLALVVIAWGPMWILHTARRRW